MQMSVRTLSKTSPDGLRLRVRERLPVPAADEGVRRLRGELRRPAARIDAEDVSPRARDPALDLELVGADADHVVGRMAEAARPERGDRPRVDDVEAGDRPHV